jgi:hypothetical protein
MKSALPFLACFLAGCASVPSSRCASHEQPSITDVFYFGTATPDGVVSDEQWTLFLRDVVTPRFPQGLTTWRASGQWLGKDGKLVLEDSHVLSLVHARDSVTEPAIAGIIAEYKVRFRQEAVLRVKSESCVTF